jgi:3',5'-cyclic-AMP phosphodiesterase
MRFAHLTDVHMNGTADRRQRLGRALDDAMASGAKHLLLTGDLTDSGRPEQFQELAWALGRWHRTTTIVGGNHDGAGFESALSGCLGRFASTSVVPFIVGGVRVVPISTYYPRRALAFRALGSIGRDQFAALEQAVLATRGPVVVAMHHGPQIDPLKAFAGLVDRHRIEGLLRSNPQVSVCCGHDHRVIDIGQVHVAASCATHPDPLRVYDVGVGRFESVYRSECEGSYFGDAVCPVRS